MILAHWTYTKEEWKAFIYSGSRKKNFLLRIFNFFLPVSLKVVPEIRITPEKILIGNNNRHFRNAANQLRQINIREEGSINIMEIRYESVQKSTIVLNEIRIPVPKGKLKEAFEVEKKINEAGNSTQRG